MTRVGARGSNPNPKKAPTPTGLPLVDGLVALHGPTISDYVAAASEYVLVQKQLTDGAKKTAQIRLSSGLGRALLREFRARLPTMGPGATVGEVRVAGALRTAKTDLVEFDPHDGLRLGVEIKPVNLAVGRAIWNRFGDIRVSAVNLHLKFPFAVVGGVLAIPIYEEATRNGAPIRKDTTQLIRRAVDRLVRAGGRISEAGPAHLLEGVCVVAYDPVSGTLEPNLPAQRSGLRWDEFIETMVAAYQARFGSDTDDLRDRLNSDSDDAE